jgi:hypothetical protein
MLTVLILNADIVTSNFNVRKSEMNAPLPAKRAKRQPVTMAIAPSSARRARIRFGHLGFLERHSMLHTGCTIL